MTGSARLELQHRQAQPHIAHPPAPFLEQGVPDSGPVLLSVPHSGRFYPAELLDLALLPLDQLRLLEDPLVDLMVEEAAAQTGTGIITASYARAWLDLNRRETELDPRHVSPTPAAHVDHRSPRVAAGLGLIPQTPGGGRSLYNKPLHVKAVLHRIENVHRPYHARIRARLADMGQRHGTALLCDIHSMPPLPAAHGADIVLGDRHGRTAAPWLVDLAAVWLTQRGYRVARNLPYAGGHGVERHGCPGEGVHAMQIEIDRRLYLKNDRLAFNDNAPAIARMIADFVSMLIDALEAGSPHRIAAE